MRTVHLLGCNGFIGRAIQRKAKNVLLHCWGHQQQDPQHYFNLLDDTSWQSLLSMRPTHVILLSWPGLPSYQETFHVTQNLPACVHLVEELIKAGVKRLVVAGTCYEYGLQNGSLKEDQLTDPVNCYAIAKDSLRRVIRNLCDMNKVEWIWVRIFYPFGPGQNPKSFLPSLQMAIDEQKMSFAMSSGRQLRDFVEVDQVASMLLHLVCHQTARGIYNCGSGTYISLRELAEQRIQESMSRTSLELGHYPDREDEPVAFWANTEKFSNLP